MLSAGAPVGIRFARFVKPFHAAPKLFTCENSSAVRWGGLVAREESVGLCVGPCAERGHLGKRENQHVACPVYVHSGCCCEK